MHPWVHKQLNRYSAAALNSVARVAGALRLKKQYNRLIVRLVHRTGLFDEIYYCRNNPDVVGDGMEPVSHYVAYGDKENRLPMSLFDPGYYRRNEGKYHPKKLNALVHYSLVGRFEGIATSPWFNTAYYLASNRDVKFKRIDPLVHFLKYGGREGRSPNHTFDSEGYLLANPEVASAGINPLLHHLGCIKMPENSVPGKLTDACPVCLRVVAPSPGQWKSLVVPANSAEPLVDVIIPIYKGKEETLQCIYNVIRFVQKTSFELVIINDASPVQSLSMALDELHKTYGFTYIINKTNIGYVRSVNAGMQLHPDRDVVLLNADTKPNNNWLDRLRVAALREPRIGTVTPLSNNATICSYPVFDHDNPCPIEIPSRTLDRIARKVNAGCAIESPTAVGFCMYIKRECLNEVGLFDEFAFELGYGEENDFCQRAIKKNWKHVIAPNVFIWHWGARSFQGLKGKRIKKALKVLKKRYPEYLPNVSAFVADDPLYAARRRMDEARLSDQICDHNVLIVTHNRGGGTDRSIMEHGRRMRCKGASLFYLTPSNKRHCARLSSEPVKHLPNLIPVDFRTPDSFHQLVMSYRISEIHIHQLIDFGEFAPSVIATCAEKVGLRLEVFVHDYQSICPRINLVNASGIFCGEPDERCCNVCLKKKIPGNRIKAPVDIHTWRSQYGRLFSMASVVNVPNRDVKIRLRRWFSDCRVTVTPPETLAISDCKRASRTIRKGERLRVVVVGAIVPIKGFDVLKACAIDVIKQCLPIEYKVMGYTKEDRALSNLGVTVTGRYNDGEAVELLQSLEPDLVWLPSIWPETYSYTLSWALLAGFDIAAFDLGAIARRLKSSGRADHLQPLAWARHPSWINAAFLKVRQRKMEDGNPQLSTVTPIQAV